MSNLPAISLVLVMLSAAVTGQTTLNVPSLAYPTIQSALNAAVAQDLIVVGPGTFVENLVWPALPLTLRGAGINTTFIDGAGQGPCILVNAGAAYFTVIEGFTLMNGRGTIGSLHHPTESVGGGLALLATSGGAAITLRDCEITLCQAETAASLYLEDCAATLIDRVAIHNNSVLTTAMGSAAELVCVSGVSSLATLRDCSFDGYSNTAIPAAPLILQDNSAALSLDGCHFEANQLQEAMIAENLGGFLRINRCSFLNNLGLAAKPLVLESFFPSITEFYDCLVAGNFGSHIARASGLQVRNCSIVDNTVTSNVAAFDSSTLVVRNTISWGNRDASLQVIDPFAPGNGVLIVEYCDIEGAFAAGVGNIAADPLFLDRGNGDYRLLPGSPAVDAGDPNAIFLPTQLDAAGRPRWRNFRVDMGAIEADGLAHHPDSGGKVGTGMGGPYDLLLVNGTTGGPRRTVSVPVGSSATVTMLQPSFTASPLSFVIFCFLGEANFDTVTFVPFGIGNMMFAPAPMVPVWAQSWFFTLTDNFNPAASQLMSSTPTPWTSGPGATIPFPLTLSLQGVVEEAPSVYRSTNAIIYELR